MKLWGRDTVQRLMLIELGACTMSRKWMNWKVVGRNPKYPVIVRYVNILVLHTLSMPLVEDSCWREGIVIDVSTTGKIRWGVHCIGFGI